MTHNELARLFSQEERPRVFSSIADEMSAVYRGDKGISMFSFPRSAVDDNDDDYAEIAQTALDARLMLTVVADLHSAPAHEQVYVFVHREDGGWRIPAWLATRKILSEYAWCDGLEALESAILGYSEEQVSRWISYRRARQVGWRGRTVHMLMTRHQQDRIVEHGCRSFPENMPANDRLKFFISRSLRPMRPEAAQQVAADTAIARVEVSRDSFRALFSSILDATDGDVASVELHTTEAVALNRALESRIEFLSAKGWR